ncbi:MAG: Rap1a/Tai family immunity protein [Hydrogenophaga sp.]|nr:Rap1a/Tai family immunity protein [Hydrogenophaga sp.]MDP1782331.1 Rap1a/Tai family immunity protein [Hydrogenophaga sp.]
MRQMVIGVALLCSVGSAAALDGNKLLTGCTAVVRFLDAGNKGLDDNEMMDSSLCLGMMEGVSHTVLTESFLAERTQQKSLLATCLPSDGINNGQAARIVVRYLNQNPDKLHLSAAMLTLFAFKNSFPCK